MNEQNESNEQPYMQDVASVLNKLQKDGYTEDFRVTAQGLQAPGSEKAWPSADVRLLNFYRFEGTSNPDDEAVIYVIETSDGVRGTLTDAYGMNADPYVSAFLKDLAPVDKKAPRH